MFFVDDHQAQLVNGSKHRGARADHDVHLTAPNPMPLIVPFAVREPAVLHRHPPGRGLKRPDHGRREGDLRHQHQDPPPLTSDMLSQPKIDDRLAAPGDAVEKRHLKLPLPPTMP